MDQAYNLKSPSVKRLMREACEMAEATSEYAAKPLEDNLFEWHFTIRGPSDSDFDGGYYHGRIILPPEYPMKPPSILMMTPNGRFELHKKICLSISGYHPESWQPSWSIRTAILAIIGFMPTKGEGAIGALDYTSEERKKLAKQSQNYSCSTCGLIKHLLPSAGTSSSSSAEIERREKELAKQIVFAKPKTDKTAESRGTEATSTDDNSPEIATGDEATAENESETISAHLPAPSLATEPQPAVQQTRSDTTSLWLMAVLAVAIAILLVRRIGKTFSFDDLTDEI